MISRRLKAIANLITAQQIVADIGTDHAYLPIYLLEQDITNKVYACDINPNPLQIAKANIQKKNYSNQIETILSDGIQNVPSDAQCIVIAGMGAHTAIHILENDFARLTSFKEIITSVHTNVDILRTWLYSHHFTILQELTIQEDGHFYQVIKWNANQTDYPYTKEEIILGYKPSTRKDPDFFLYCAYAYEKVTKLLSYRVNDPELLYLQKLYLTYKKNAD